jgi:hypothetical protein
MHAGTQANTVRRYRKSRRKGGGGHSWDHHTRAQHTPVGTHLNRDTRQASGLLQDEGGHGRGGIPLVGVGLDDDAAVQLGLVLVLPNNTTPCSDPPPPSKAKGHKKEREEKRAFPLPWYVTDQRLPNARQQKPGNENPATNKRDHVWRRLIDKDTHIPRASPRSWGAGRGPCRRR